jgi:hypothetical protein
MATIEASIIAPSDVEYSRIRHIAMALFMGRWKSSSMAMFTTYLDASGSPDQGVALSVAGFVATTEQWIEFERNWKEVLEAYGVSQLHMREFAHSVDEFASWKNDERKRRRFLERLVNVIKTRTRYCVVSCVMLDHYRKVDKIYPLHEMNKPFALAGITAIQKVKDWAKTQNIDEDEIAYMFEDGDADKGDLIRCSERDHDISPVLMKKRQSCAFQAADLLAYEHRLANKKIFASGPGTLALSDLRGSLRALDYIPHGNDGEGWGVYDEHDLEQHCVKNKYPRRC